MESTRAQKKKVYLVRHGETDWNFLKRVQGNGIDTDLNMEGQTQAKALAIALQDIPFDFLASSDLKRALQTMEFVQKQHNHSKNLPVNKYRDLQEMNYGKFEGRYFDQSHPETIWPDLQIFLDLWKNENHTGTKLPEGESPKDVEYRAVKVIRDILMQKDVNNCLIICHGRLLKVVLCSLLEKGLHKMHEVEQYNTAINILEFDPETERFEVICLNSTEHLIEK